MNEGSVQECFTSHDVVTLLKKRFGDSRQYAYATEVATCPGGGVRRLDMVVVNCYASRGYAIEGIEVKISKSDLRRELQDASKHNVFFDSLDYYSLACPEDIVDMSLIPPKWGVYVVRKNGDLRIKRKPLSICDDKRDEINKAFAVSLIRSINTTTPSKDELSKVREEGVNLGAAQERQRREYRNTEMERERLAAYEKLFAELNLWSGGSIERGIAGFKEYQNVDAANLRSRLKYLREGVDKAMLALPAEVEK